MPKPKKNESKQDYLKRCTKELIEKEGRDPDQAYAMCNAYWNDAHNQRPVLTLSAPIELKKTEEDKPPIFMITAYTGRPLNTWFGDVIFDVKGMRAKAKIPILREHARDRIVGYSTKTWTDETNFYVFGSFSQKTRDGKEVLALAEEGFPFQASVGIWPLKVKVLAKGAKEVVNGHEIEGPAEIWTESDVGEVSFVALGRDDETAAIVLDRDDGNVPVEIENVNSTKEEEKMPITREQLEKEAPELIEELTASARNEGFEQGKAEGEKLERERVSAILASDADPEAMRKAITDGLSLADSYKLFFEAEKERRTKALAEMEASAPGSAGQEPPPEGADQGDTFEAKVQEFLDKGEAKTRFEAISLAAKRFPQLHEDYIKTINKRR